MAKAGQLGRASILLVPLAMLISGCETDGSPLLLDLICGPQTYYSPGTGASCTVTGDAVLTSGVTGNATGVHFGAAGSGELRIRINAIPATYQGVSWSLEALAASSRSEGSTLYRSLTWGTCVNTTCPPNPNDVEVPLDEDFVWAGVIDDAPNLGAGNYPPDDANITLRGADIDLVDLRTPGFDGQNYYYY